MSMPDTHSWTEGMPGFVFLGATLVIGLFGLVRMRHARLTPYPRHSLLQVVVILVASAAVSLLVWKLYARYCM
jgi:hypothetical protein